MDCASLVQRPLDNPVTNHTIRAAPYGTTPVTPATLVTLVTLDCEPASWYLDSKGLPDSIVDADIS